MKTPRFVRTNEIARKTTVDSNWQNFGKLKSLRENSLYVKVNTNEFNLQAERKNQYW